MIRLGLIGYPLSHSLSPQLHAAAFEALGLQGEYRLYPIAPDDTDGLVGLARRVRDGDLQGLNVTIPHKQTIIPLLDEMTPSAQTIGAVNTLYLKGRRLVGHNTDAPGFLEDLKRTLLSSPFPIGREESGVREKAIVLGSGGGARAVVYALLQGGWQVVIAALLMDQAEELAKTFQGVAGDGSARVVPNERAALSRELEGTRLIVNASPVGMSPNVDGSPWPEGLAFPPRAVVYDLVYNPRETLFLRQARAAGLRAASGIGTLVEQAALSFACWTGQEPPRDVMFRAVEA
jgi:shikimate dehydrogenase